tara:strand:- start:97 stop:378 length:282 start_codon:yes stop_codon:yes gene_type:complete
MKITKINKIISPAAIPNHHLKWCPPETRKKAEAEKKPAPEILDGELVLYDRHGKIVVHKGDNNGTTEESKENLPGQRQVHEVADAPENAPENG